MRRRPTSSWTRASGHSSDARCRAASVLEGAVLEVKARSSVPPWLAAAIERTYVASIEFSKFVAATRRLREMLESRTAGRRTRAVLAWVLTLALLGIYGSLPEGTELSFSIPQGEGGCPVERPRGRRGVAAHGGSRRSRHGSRLRCGRHRKTQGLRRQTGAPRAGAAGRRSRRAAADRLRRATRENPRRRRPRAEQALRHPASEPGTAEGVQKSCRWARASRVRHLLVRARRS